MATMTMPRPTKRKPIARKALPSARDTGRAARATAKAISTASRKAGAAQGRRRAGNGARKGRIAAFVVGSSAGAAAEYLLDPQDGKRRRHMLRDRAAAKLRSGRREAERRAHQMAGKAQGVVADATTPGRDSSELNDPALEAKVESELLRPADVGRSSINVNVAEGRVQLRGELDSREQIEDLIKRAERIDGVSGVDNLLHLPGEPAPHSD